MPGASIPVGRELESAANPPVMLWPVLAAATLVPVAVQCVLFALRVPLGLPGKFTYVYSPVALWRAAAVPWVLVAAVLLAAAVWMLAGETVGRRRLGLVLLAAGAVTLGGWSYLAPPQFASQHTFNMLSPSHDGAFLAEARRIPDLRAYLSYFPERARTPPEAMRGTRVISNPPGATVLAVATRAALERWPALAGAVDWMIEPGGLEPVARRRVREALAFSVVLLLMWLAAVPVLYAVGRAFLPRAVAAVYAVCCVFTPATLMLSPGKDPAQLLTLGLPLLLWLRARGRGGVWPAMAAGAVFVAGCVMGLVHVWLALVVLAASAWAERVRIGELLVRGVLPAAAGAAGAVVLLAAGCGLNLPAAMQAVAAAQASVTRGPDAMPLAWQMLGVPLFLQFAGPALWFSLSFFFGGRREGGRDARAPRGDSSVPRGGEGVRGARAPRQLSPFTCHSDDVSARFGRGLLAAAAVVMVGTAGFTNAETPRLWIPFLPLILLGLLTQAAWLRGPTRSAAGVLAVLVGAQVIASAAQWVLMDMREAETRLLESEPGGARFFD